jgi:hypothetical protein
MPSRDERDRVAQASPVPVERASEDAEVAGGTAGKFTHELPEGLRSPRLQVEYWTSKGVSDAEAILIVNTLRQQNGGLVEFDEDAEAERLARRKEQQTRLARVDGGDNIQVQISATEAYFVGAVPRGDGRFCERKPYMSPRDEKVWINGYHFSIPRHTRVVVPTEVIDLLESAARSRGDFDVVSAAFQARQMDPINLHENVIPTPGDITATALNYSYGDPFARR